MTPNEFIKANGYEWQPSFNGAVSETINAYRGALIIEEGKKLSETKVMPPKAQAKQVIMLRRMKLQNSLHVKWNHLHILKNSLKDTKLYLLQTL